MSTGIPLQSAANMDDPREHVAWALVGLAGPQAHAPMILPLAVQGSWSEQLYKAGFRHHPELQEIKYVPPAKDTNWVMGAAGQWVDINEPLPAEVTAPDTSDLSLEEKQYLLASLAKELAPTVREAQREKAVAHG